MLEKRRRTYGYACINMGFSTRPKKKRITTNRSMIRRTFDDRGIKYASELSLLNVRDLNKILDWNLENDIFFYRMSSDVVPWASEYQLTDLPDYKEIAYNCRKAGEFAKRYHMRITSHPGHFNKLASPKERVFDMTKKDLTVHGELF